MRIDSDNVIRNNAIAQTMAQSTVYGYQMPFKTAFFNGLQGFFYMLFSVPFVALPLAGCYSRAMLYIIRTCIYIWRFVFFEWAGKFFPEIFV